MREIILDRIDRLLQDGVKENPGACIRDIIKPFYLERSEPVLRRRMEMLCLRGLIRMEKTKREILCYPIENDAKRGDEL